MPPLPEPPAKANPAAFYLLRTFNEAMANNSNWPSRQPDPASGRRPVQTLYGRRRLDWFSRHANGFETELRTMPLIKKLAGTKWECAGAGGSSGRTTEVELARTGDVSGIGRGGVRSPQRPPNLASPC